MAEVVATEPQGSLEGSRYLGSLNEASQQQRGCVWCGAHPVAGLEGLTGGQGEKIKVSVGPQTVAVVRLYPLPLPTLLLFHRTGPGGAQREPQGL